MSTSRIAEILARFPGPNTRKLANVVFVTDRQQKRVLLGYKKRGFGAHKYNGFGGKVDYAIDTSVAQSAMRELHEEAGILGDEITLRLRGLIFFEFDPKDEPKLLEVHVYETNGYSGTITESDEMAPQWFAFDQIPIEQMWEDDKHWLQPHLIANEKDLFRAYYHFSAGFGPIDIQDLVLVDKEGLASDTFDLQLQQYQLNSSNTTILSSK